MTFEQFQAWVESPEFQKMVEKEKKDRKEKYEACDLEENHPFLFHPGPKT